MKIIGEKLFEKSFSPNPFSKTFKQMYGQSLCRFIELILEESHGIE
jgi:hypothetical protein